jgi:subtilase family serine protease
MHRAIAAGVSVVLVTGALVSGAAATTARSMTRVGAAPRRPAGTRVVGSLAGTTRIPVTITLQPPDPAALQSYATAVSTPGSSSDRHYLSAAAFRARFAPTDAQIAAVRSAISSDGLTPSPVSANGLVITLSASATQLSSAFSTSFDQVELADGHAAYANTSAPAVPSAIASTIQSVTGLNSLAVARPLGLGGRADTGLDRAAAERPNLVTGGPQACDAGRVTPNGYTADDLASSYGFSGLYGQNDLGAGETIGLLELEPYDQSDVSEYASCYGISPLVTNISVDGFDATGARLGEANNDIEDVIGLAPGASVLVYEAPNTAAGVLDDLARMVSDDRADVMSTSWGICEAETSPGFVAAENLELEEAAIQGQSFFAAAGDAGSADCGSGDPELSVDDPGGQPFITAVGGTQLSALGPPPTETTWNDGGNAGGGGISRDATMPAYQLDAALTVNVIDGNSTGSPCAAPAGEFCRETPDVSASSSMNRGYDFYQDGKWVDWFGTSFAAPLWAAFTALANASPACTGVDIGFVNPLLYQLAGSDYGKYFNDITTGDNDVNDINGGLYPASAGHDMATGLGSPIGTPLAQGLCDTKQAAITFTNPGEQTGTAGTPVNVSLSAADVNSASITYAVQGLPAGLTVNSATGLITGTPTSAGATTVTAVATDTDGATATVVFGWNVASPTPAAPTAAPPVPPTASIPHAVILKLKIAKHTNATITFSSKGGTPQTYQCALAKLPKPKQHHPAAALHPHYRTCRSPVIYRHLSAAHYEFFVHAKGISGVYSSAATKKFTIG